MNDNTPVQFDPSIEIKALYAQLRIDLQSAYEEYKRKEAEIQRVFEEERAALMGKLVGERTNRGGE